MVDGLALEKLTAEVLNELGIDNINNWNKGLEIYPKVREKGVDIITGFRETETELLKPWVKIRDKQGLIECKNWKKRKTLSKKDFEKEILERFKSTEEFLRENYDNLVISRIVVIGVNCLPKSLVEQHNIHVIELGSKLNNDNANTLKEILRKEFRRLIDEGVI